MKKLMVNQDRFQLLPCQDFTNIISLKLKDHVVTGTCYPNAQIKKDILNQKKSLSMFHITRGTQVIISEKSVF